MLSCQINPKFVIILLDFFTVRDKIIRQFTEFQTLHCVLVYRSINVHAVS